MTTNALRIALFSHDTMGLGHMRRNLLLAHTLAACERQPVILSIVGNSEARRFSLPPRSDRLVLPALTKDGNGGYQPRSLGVDIADVIRLRSQVTAAALTAFAPDLLIVDNVPRGAMRELDETLEALAATSTRVVLGLRDVLDAPERVEREWRELDNFGAIRAYYDQIWVYGDPAVYDSLAEYRFPADIAARVRFTGYFDLRARLQFAGAADHRILDEVAPHSGPLVLCLLGGGQDGAAVANAFAAATAPAGTTLVIVTGPFLPAGARAALAARAERDDRFKVIEFLPEPTVLLERADRVIAMGGYNTAWEIVSFGKPALIVPRVKPRQEQWIRARRLAELGLVEVIHPDRLSAATITEYLAGPPRTPAPIHTVADLKGLERLPRLALDLVHSHTAVKEPQPWHGVSRDHPHLRLVTSSNAIRATPRHS